MPSCKLHFWINYASIRKAINNTQNYQMCNFFCYTWTFGAFRMSKWGTWVNLWISRVHLTRQQKNVSKNSNDLVSRRLSRTRSTWEFACMLLKGTWVGNSHWSPSVSPLAEFSKELSKRHIWFQMGYLSKIIQWWAFLLTASHRFYFVTFLRSLREKLLDSLLQPVLASEV